MIGGQHECAAGLGGSMRSIWGRSQPYTTGTCPRAIDTLNFFGERICLVAKLHASVRGLSSRSCIGKLRRTPVLL